VKLADNTYVEISEGYLLKFTIGSRTFQHEFDIMEALSWGMLIGVDIWAELLPLPPPHVIPPRAQTAAVFGGMLPHTPDEEQRLHAFLRSEFCKFNAVTRPTASNTASD